MYDHRRASNRSIKERQGRGPPLLTHYQHWVLYVVQPWLWQVTRGHYGRDHALQCSEAWLSRHNGVHASSITLYFRLLPSIPGLTNALCFLYYIHLFTSVKHSHVILCYVWALWTTTHYHAARHDSGYYAVLLILNVSLWSTLMIVAGHT